MKKTLLSVLAGLAVITSASAGIKETCLENPDKLVWVEKTGECIPVNPCEKGEKYNAYCIRAFKRTQTEKAAQSYFMTEQYLKFRGVSGLTRHEAGTSLNNSFGQDYIAYKTGDGYYYQFEIDDTDNTTLFGPSKKYDAMYTVISVFPDNWDWKWDTSGYEDGVYRVTEMNNKDICDKIFEYEKAFWNLGERSLTVVLEKNTETECVLRYED